MRQSISFAILIVCGLFGTAFGQANGQQENEERFRDKLFTGGSVGVSLGSYTNVNFSPIIGARLTDQFYAGAGIEYQYTRYKYARETYTSSQYGGRLFTQYNVVPQLYLHTEFSLVNLEHYTLNQKDRSFVPFLYVGGGYRQLLTNRSFVTFQVLFDVIQDKNSPYNSWEPIYSVGFGVDI